MNLYCQKTYAYHYRKLDELQMVRAVWWLRSFSDLLGSESFYQKTVGKVSLFSRVSHTNPTSYLKHAICISFEI